MNASTSQVVQSFLAGFTACAALIYLSRKAQSSFFISTKRFAEVGIVNVNGISSSTPTAELMDSVALDQRMIRKAEGAILNRTSRLIIVVVRCTNDHNYSAIL